MADHTLGLAQTGHDGAKQVPLRLRRIEFGPLPNAGTLNKAHGITPFDMTKVVRVWGTATDGAGSLLPLPHVDTGTPASGITLIVTATLVVITTGANFSSFTGTVFIEYIP